MHTAVLVNILLATLASALPAVKRSSDGNTNSPGYVSLSAQKLHGSSFANAVSPADVKPQVYVRDDDSGSGSGYFSMDLLNENTFYLTHIELGTPAQKIGVLVDTGSSDFWVISKSNPYCGDSSQNSGLTTNCSLGTFDETASSTFHSNGTSFFITYGDNSSANGTWGYDDAVIGGISINDLSVAVGAEADTPSGLLGIGLPELESTNLATEGETYIYENLPLKLKSSGIINQAAYSLFLTDATSGNAEVLFGAVDHSKYKGSLVTLPMLNTLTYLGFKSPGRLQVTLNSLTLVDNQNKVQGEIGSGAAAALLDSGTTYTHLPIDVYAALISIMNVEYSETLQRYVADCSDGDYISLEFNFQDFIIDIPFSSFLVPLITKSGDSSSYCMIDFLPSSDDTFILGDDFLRNVYMVADFDNLEIAIANADHSNSASANIEVISSGIPSATSGNSDLLWGQSSSMTALSDVQLSSIPTGDATIQTASQDYVNPTQTLTSSNIAVTHATVSQSVENTQGLESIPTARATGATNTQATQATEATEATQATQAQTTDAESASATAAVSSISTTHKNDANEFAPAFGTWAGIAIAVAALI